MEEMMEELQPSSQERQEHLVDQILGFPGAADQGENGEGASPFTSGTPSAKRRAAV